MDWLRGHPLSRRHHWGWGCDRDPRLGNKRRAPLHHRRRHTGQGSSQTIFRGHHLRAATPEMVGLANRAHSTVYSRDTIRAGPPPCSLHIPNKNVPQDQMSCGTSAFLLVGTYSCAAPSAAASGRSQLVIIPPSSSKVAVFTIWDLPTRISWVPSSLDRLSFTVPSMVKTRL